MTPELEEQLEGMMLATGYDDCILGIAERCGQPNVVAYDTRAIVRLLQLDGMTEDEAWEFFLFNISGAYVGEQTPIFINLWQHTKHQHGPEKRVRIRKAGSTPKAEPATTARRVAISSRPRQNRRPQKTRRVANRSVRACRA